MKATRIKMKPGCANSTKTTEIDQIYIEGCSNPGYYKKADIYDHLKSHPNSIYVDISPYPDLIPALSSNYVPNLMTHLRTIFSNYREADSKRF